MKPDVILGLALLLGACAFSSCSQSELSTKAETPFATPPVAVSAPSPEPSPLIKAMLSSLPIQLIKTGEFHGAEVNARSGQQWLGLYADARGSQLIWSKLKIEMVVDPIGDVDVPGQKTGKSVQVGRNVEPLFLVRNAPMLQPGKVVTIFQSSDEQPQSLFGDNLSSLNLNGQSYRFSFQYHCRSAEAPDKPACAELKLSNGITTQTIYQMDDPWRWAGWYLKWAGDLDLDGRLDFYLDGSDEDNAEKRRLYLSSAAKPGALVEMVAEFVITGC